jgi:hypothetical protein
MAVNCSGKPSLDRSGSRLTVERIDLKEMSHSVGWSQKWLVLQLLHGSGTGNRTPI